MRVYFVYFLPTSCRTIFHRCRRTNQKLFDLKMELTILLITQLLVNSASFCLCDRQIRLPSSEPYMYPSLDSNNTCPNKTTPLYFGLIQSFSASQIDGSGTIAGINVALDEINSNCSLLPGYSLHYTVADSQVS